MTLTDQASVIPEVDLFIGQEEIDAITTSIDRRWLTEGPFTIQLAEHIQKITGSSFVTFAPNGTLGLFLALLALDLPRNSEIIVPSFTFYASAATAIFAGLKPVFVDVHPDTFQINCDLIRKKISPATKAIMPVHCYGQSCDMEALLDIADEYKLAMVEDAAQGFGCIYKSQHVGTFGDIGVISLFSDKVVTMGEGAAILVQDPKLFEKIRLLRNQGRPSSGTFIHPELGMNFRVTDIQSAIGLQQIKKFSAIREHRISLWNFYSKALAGVGDIKFMKLTEGSNLIPFRFPFLTKRAKELRAYLQEQGIQNRSFFYPMHLQPKLRQEPPESLPECEMLAERGVCIPVHQYIDNERAERTASVIKYFYARV